MRNSDKCSDSYQDWLIEELKNHELAAAYLNAAIEESLKGDEESQQIFITALKNVAEAQGGVEHLVKKAALNKENLDKVFSTQNAKKRHFLEAWDALTSLTKAMGLDLKFC